MKTKDERIKEYLDFMGVMDTFGYENLDNLGFFTAPASTRFHGSYEGGLFDHSLEVAKSLVELTENLGLKWKRPESPYIVGMFHDLCKCDNYVWDIESESYTYNPDIIIPGHGEKSIIMYLKLDYLTDEEIACIRWHMGAFEKDPKLWEYYNRAIENYPNVLYTHTADMIASKIVGV